MPPFPQADRVKSCKVVKNGGLYVKWVYDGIFHGNSSLVLDVLKSLKFLGILVAPWSYWMFFSVL